MVGYGPPGFMPKGYHHFDLLGADYEEHLEAIRNHLKHAFEGYDGMGEGWQEWVKTTDQLILIFQNSPLLEMPLMINDPSYTIQILARMRLSGELPASETQQMLDRIVRM